MKLYVFIFCFLITLYTVQLNYADESDAEDFKNEVSHLKSNLSFTTLDIESTHNDIKSLANSNLSALAKESTITIQMVAQETVNNITKYIIDNKGKEVDPSKGQLCREEALISLLSISTQADMKLTKCFNDAKRMTLLYLKSLAVKQYVAKHLNTDLDNHYDRCFGNTNGDRQCSINSLKDIKEAIEAYQITIPTIKNTARNAIFNAITEQQYCNSNAESVARAEFANVQLTVAECLERS